MIPTLGHVAVVVGLATTLFAAAVFALGGRRRDPVLVTAGRGGPWWPPSALALLGCAAMVISLLTHDFSVSYVVRNNATTTPPFYSFISLWAALEGSILFWTLLATGWAALVLHRFRRSGPGADAVGGDDAGAGDRLLLRGHDLAGRPVPAHLADRGRGHRAERAAAEPPVHGPAPAAAVPGLHRPGHALRLRRGGADHAAAPTRNGWASSAAGRWCRGSS